MEKIIIVGGSFAGASFGERLKRLSPKTEVRIYEKTKDIGYNPCALPHYFSGEIEDQPDLYLKNEKILNNRYGLETFTEKEVLLIDREEKRVKVKDLATGKEFWDDYDKLVLATGAKTRVPEIKGLEKNTVFSVKTLEGVEKTKDFLKTAEHIVILGGSVTGTEVLDSINLENKKITMIESSSQIIPDFDEDLIRILHKEMNDQGVDLLLEDEVVEVKEKSVLLKSGKEIPADGVFLCLGEEANVDLGEKAGLQLGETKAYKVDENYQTTDSSIYAIGNNIEVTNTQSQEKMPSLLASPAELQGRELAEYFSSGKTRELKYTNTYVTRLLGYHLGKTGLSAKDCENLSLDYDRLFLIAQDRGAGLNPEFLFLKLFFEKPSGKILGLQIIGKNKVDKYIDTIASMINFDGTVEDLSSLPFAYTPMVGTPDSPLNLAGKISLDLIEGRLEQIHHQELREIIDDQPMIIDVREKEEFANGHLKGAENIPLGEVVERSDEIPKDQPVYMTCGTSTRAYHGIQKLQGIGFDNLVLIEGSFLGLTMVEDFKVKKGIAESLFEF